MTVLENWVRADGMENVRARLAVQIRRTRKMLESSDQAVERAEHFLAGAQVAQREERDELARLERMLASLEHKS